MNKPSVKTYPVTLRRESICLPTYEPLPPDKNPMFLEKRVYQGSSGAVYPLPFYDRIAEKTVERAWDAIILANEFLEIMILPEIGGRIHRGKDKTNGYDFFYRQDVIKPALVGLAGPWISGGVEFNWPQHHRPATFMPTEVEIEKSADGSITVWCGDHDPLQRMKGMHGVCLRPGQSLLELKVRAYNRTPLVQTFLWWANVATRVHEAYQSFFPSDVFYVADHARRSMSKYPLCEGSYYGVDYAARALSGVPAGEAPPTYKPRASGGTTPVDYAPNDLSFYANIPVPTSYMCMGSKEDFFGGYDHYARAGVVHVANHHIAPGKKQWTWGNHEFGYAWDRSLTDPDAKGECAPYIELMAGVYTDNQPDFAFLNPGETKTWSQFWYPIREIGPARHAEAAGAISLALLNKSLRLGVAVTARHPRSTIVVERHGKSLARFTRDLSPDLPFLETIPLSGKTSTDGLRVSVLNAEGHPILSCETKTAAGGEVPPPATEPLPPEDIASNDELFLTGLHLSQYRHATRSPEPYWREAVRRDPGDARCHTALGIFHLRRGEFPLAESHLRAAIARLTLRNGNPADGEAHYHLGLTLRHLGRPAAAYAAFYKAAWNLAWQSASYHALAELDCQRGDFPTALDHLDRSLRLNTDHLRARNLRAMVLTLLGRERDARESVTTTRTLDPLDSWARLLSGEPLQCDTQARFDLVLDLVAAGFHHEAWDLLLAAQPGPGDAPLRHYYLAWIADKNGNLALAQSHRGQAQEASPDYCFPARIEEIAILESATLANPDDARAPYYLANLFYGLRRHAEAICLWEISARLDPTYSVVWRNLGIGYFNILQSPDRAASAYDLAFQANPTDARLLYERDQLWKRTAVPPARRLQALRQHPELVTQRDDLSVEICTLFNLTDSPHLALEILEKRNFQPWEGGEGMALGQYVLTHLNLGRAALRLGDAPTALLHFEQTLRLPASLGEARHLLANQSEVQYWLGTALQALGRASEAKNYWKQAADFRGDFQDMSLRAYSEMTYYSALSMGALGRKKAAEKLLSDLLKYAKNLAATEPKIDYFATSLPTMLIFNEDLQERQKITAQFLEAQALLGLDQRAKARRLLKAILARDPAHAKAADLMNS